MFTEIPASPRSIAQRKPVYGIGTNDADYLTKIERNGKRYMCPFYTKWKGMLERGYCPKLHKQQPTYADCSVAEEWHLFSTFKDWMRSQNGLGLELDKDILLIGNRIYSPETCCFVTRQINGLLNDHAAARGESPPGVCWDKKASKYRAQIRIHGKKTFIGLFTTVEAAEQAYNAAKKAYIIACAQDQLPHIKAGLLRHAERYT
jgi:hypothetical protein